VFVVSFSGRTGRGLTDPWITDRDTTEEIEAAFKLFTGGADGPIKLEDLRRIARELKEEVTEEQLRDMIGEATSKDIRRGVDL
jgi:Ca2+-binding EF-hand superfamily protein